MIWRLGGSEKDPIKMLSQRKRSWSAGSSVVENTSVVVISDDEEPPRKIRKSATPDLKTYPNVHPASKSTLLTVSSTDLTRAKSFPHVARSPTLVSTPTPPKESHPVKKPSPWTRRPPWQNHASLPSSSRGEQHGLPTPRLDRGHSTTIESSRKPAKGPQEDQGFLRNLSISDEISQENQSLLLSFTAKSDRRSNTSQTTDSAFHGETGSGQSVGTFKLGSVTSLRFNPQNDLPVSQPAASIAQRQARDHTTSGHALRHVGYLPNPSRADAVNLHTVRETQSRSESFDLPPSYLPATPANKQSSLFPPRAHQAPKISINVPLTDGAKLRQERKKLQEDLKRGPAFIKKHPLDVERVLGLTGFSKEFSADVYEGKFRKAAQTHQRKVERDKVTLNILPAQQHEAIQSQKHSFIHPKEQAKAILTARFSEHINPPLTFSNTFNDRRLNGKFQFISEYALRKGVKTTGQIGRAGCLCKHQCHNSCLCLQKAFKDEKTKEERFELIPQYEQRSDGLIVLRDDFIRRYTIIGHDAAEGRATQKPKQRVEITECNNHCSCDQSCTNRVVQKGRTVALDIFETQRCGFGVRPLEHLVKGQFIELYLGEVITEAELVQREEAAEAGSTSYIYSLDWFSPQQPYHVDGENFGSAMRFVNHSCDPNAGTFTVLNEKSTKQLHHVAFFAIKDIPAGTEITIDYTPQAAGTTYDRNEADDDMEKCYCGAKKCRQMLWLPGKERKARKKLGGRFNS